MKKSPITDWLRWYTAIDGPKGFTLGPVLSHLLIKRRAASVLALLTPGAILPFARRHPAQARHCVVHKGGPFKQAVAHLDAELASHAVNAVLEEVRNA